MRCPFLREAQVKFCCASEFKKLIVRTSAAPISGIAENAERCSSPAYVDCPSAKQRFEDLPSRDHCPFLQESLCQYCAAAPAVKYVPYSDPSLTRCGTSNHRYCELLMTMQNPKLLTHHDVIAPEIDRDDENESGYWVVDGIQTVGWLHYSRNHMWADLDEDGTCHIGVDGFFTKVLGKIERIEYKTSSGEHFPSIGLTVNGIDLQVTFPRRISISTTNSHLRAEPNRVVTDPYTLGWLFEGKCLTARTKEPGQPIAETIVHEDDLLCGREAKTWMEYETRRLTEIVSSQTFGNATHDRGRSKGPRLLADGGTFTENIFGQVTREQSLFLFKEFFTLPPGGSTDI